MSAQTQKMKYKLATTLARKTFMAQYI